MNDGEDRLIGGEALQHDTVERADTALRPERLADFIGQGGGRANLETSLRPRATAAMRWTTRYFTGRQGLARRRWRRSCPPNSASGSAPLPAR